jgi:transcriptional antiterminator RfaH
MTAMTWCVVHTRPLKENVAKAHLLQQGYQVYFPKLKKTCRHARRIEEKLVPLFPRYIFVGLQLAISKWRSINGTRGVSSLLMCDDLHPAEVPFHIIEQLQSQEEEKEVVAASSLMTFVKGDKVRILEGAFQDQLAVYHSMSDSHRIQLLLNFMGREMKVILPTYAIEAL